MVFLLFGVQLEQPIRSPARAVDSTIVRARGRQRLIDSANAYDRMAQWPRSDPLGDIAYPRLANCDDPPPAPFFRTSHTIAKAAMTAINDDAIDRLFRNARTFGTFRDQPVPDEMLRRVYDLVRMAPTSANSNPGRFVFVRSPEAKARLAPALSAGNLDKTMAAPVTALVAYDTEFHEHLPRLFPHTDARSWFAGKHDFI